VPILIHAGRGMPTMTALADLALRYPDVSLVLAHAAIADQAVFATMLAGHPRVVYDTSCFSTLDVVELFARVPAERIVFGSDAPYGRPAGGLFQAMRAAAYAGLDHADRALIAGGTVTMLLEGRPLAAATPPPADSPDRRQPRADQRIPADELRRHRQRRAVAGPGTRVIRNLLTLPWVVSPAWEGWAEPAE